MGLTEEPSLHRAVDASYREISLPAEGVLLSRKLAEVLDVVPGDSLQVEVLEGSRPVSEVRVARLVEDFLGMSAYMRIGALHRIMREGAVLSGAFMDVDPQFSDALHRRLKELPAVGGISMNQEVIESFEETIGRNLGAMITYNVVFAGIIAFGVVYNNARISLSERSRELASMRVMGFTRREVAFVLLGELAAITLLAIPAGLILGYGLGALTVQSVDTELFRVPLVIAPRTMVFAALTVAAAAVVSGIIVRRRLRRSDITIALKSRE
jgi:putative ABC transport system permease protein